MNFLVLALFSIFGSSFVDKNYRSFDGFVDLVDETSESLSPSSDFNDTYKLSHGIGAKVANKHIVNRNEDCLDICRVFDARITDIVLEPFGRNGITVKGASRDVIINAVLLCHGSECDLEVGQFDNYWYPGRAPSVVSVNIASAVGQPVRVRLWDGSLLSDHFSPSARVTRIPKAIWFPYFLFRYAQLRLTNVFLRLSGGTPIKTS